MTSAVLGIDVGKSRLDAVLLVGNKIKHKSFANDNAGFICCKKWLKNLNLKPTICMEATGIYSMPPAMFLHECGYKVSVVNPVKIKRFGESQLSRTKTDKADAKSIAQYCRTMNPAPWKPKKTNQNELKNLVIYLESLITMKSQQKVRLESAIESVASIIQTHIIHLEELINNLTQKIDNIINNDSDLKRKSVLLESIPGLGKLTIPRILAYMANIEDFLSAKN